MRSNCQTSNRYNFNTTIPISTNPAKRLTEVRVPTPSDTSTTAYTASNTEIATVSTLSWFSGGVVRTAQSITSRHIPHSRNTLPAMYWESATSLIRLQYAASNA